MERDTKQIHGSEGVREIFAEERSRTERGNQDGPYWGVLCRTCREVVAFDSSPYVSSRACGGEHEAGRHSLREGSQSHLFSARFPILRVGCADLRCGDAGESRVVSGDQFSWRAHARTMWSGRWLSRSRLPTVPGAGGRLARRGRALLMTIGERRRRWWLRRGGRTGWGLRRGEREKRITENTEGKERTQSGLKRPGAKAPPFRLPGYRGLKSPLLLRRTNTEILAAPE